jgi:Spy/CpxP family protein refolding chaperone
MMQMDIRRLALAAGAVILLAAPVLAETNAPQTDTPATMGPGMCHHMMGHGMWGQLDPKAMVEGRLAYVKTALGITDDQASVWNSYADAARAKQQGVQSARDAMMKTMQSGTVIDRMQSRIAITQAALDALKAMQPSTEALYKALTPEQQKKADAMMGRGWGRI